MRKAVAARFTTLRVPRRSTLPPLTALNGHSPRNDAKWPSVLKRSMSSPTSLMMVCAVSTLMPSMRVKSTPAIRTNSPARSNAGSFPVAFFRFCGGAVASPGWAASCGLAGKLPRCLSISRSHSRICCWQKS